MDLSKILSISGKPGLYKNLAQTKNGIVVESIPEGKKFTVFSHERVSTLEEISIYTEDEDMSLKDVLKAIFEKQEGKAAISAKSSGDELKAFFENAVPDYDKDNVYVSDIKKVILWYNTLQENNLLVFEDEDEEEQPDEKEVNEETKTDEQPEKESGE